MALPSGSSGSTSARDVARSKWAVCAFALLLVAIVLSTRALLGSADAVRPAKSSQEQQIAAEVRLMLSIEADSPNGGIAHGTEVVLSPICISSADPRYGKAVATPFLHGVLGQPGDVYFRRVHNGFRVLGGLRVGDVSPRDVSARVLADLLQCDYPGTKVLRRIRAEHKAPDFVI